ncbi:LRRN4 C-terminal-like protein [Triplophysa dalaica]|uniref:LRRN4 C-terminal-like protein n=1 Tax=Triplophysa dalaica TaxID=1582913 RepID=UPI0024E0254E|nr:LRRN4 C-terminal-like protein [Triplophysa dalaica]
MLVCGRALILLLITNLLNHSFVTSSQNATRPRFRPSGGSMDYYEDISIEPPSSSPTESEYTERSECLYDMCMEQQGTCRDLAVATGCLCPGLSGSHIPPSPPRIAKVIQEDAKVVEVHWCAPTSIVTHYIVSVEGKDKVMERNLKVKDKKRAAVLVDVSAGELVCVEAVNTAGASEKNSESCITYEPQTSDSGLALKLEIIGGVVGLLVVLIVAVLLWRHKKHQRSTARRENSEGVF